MPTNTYVKRGGGGQLKPKGLLTGAHAWYTSIGWGLGGILIRCPKPTLQAQCIAAVLL